MLLTDFTTCDDVRAALGVSSDEIEDATLLLDVYVFSLEAELDELEPSPLTPYIDLKDTPPDGMSDAERLFFQATRVFCTYSVARQLLTSLPMFGPKEQTDGKASLVRFSSDPYKETIKRVEMEYEKALTRLSNRLAKLQSSTPTTAPLRPFLIGVSLGTDPVTGS